MRSSKAIFISRRILNMSSYSQKSRRNTSPNKEEEDHQEARIAPANKVKKGRYWGDEKFQTLIAEKKFKKKFEI